MKNHPFEIIVLMLALFVGAVIGCLQPADQPDPSNATIRSALVQERIDLGNLAQSIADKLKQENVTRDDQRKLWDDGAKAIRAKTTATLSGQFKRLLIAAEDLPETNAQEQQAKCLAFSKAWEAIAQEYKSP